MKPKSQNRNAESESPRAVGIILAAGSGERFGENKILYHLNSLPLIEYSFRFFSDSSMIDKIIVVGALSCLKELQEIAKKYSKVSHVLVGGSTRLESVENAVKFLEEENYDPTTILVIHNAANPWLRGEDISSVITATRKHGASLVGNYCVDTVKIVQERKVTQTLDRNSVFLAQTPQGIVLELALRGLRIVHAKKIKVTDDATLAELCGVQPLVIATTQGNTKITTKNDIERWSMGEFFKHCRIGIGQDSHRFSISPKPLVLGGVTIDNEQGLDAVSDGDVILHALYNALSSARGGGSIGKNFSETDHRNSGRSSAEFLGFVMDELRNEKLCVRNVSIAVEAARPRLENWFTAMKENISSLISVTPEMVGITVTSGEGLTECGRGEGIASTCGVLVGRR